MLYNWTNGRSEKLNLRRGFSVRGHKLRGCVTSISSIFMFWPQQPHTKVNAGRMLFAFAFQLFVSLWKDNNDALIQLKAISSYRYDCALWKNSQYRQFALVPVVIFAESIGLCRSNFACSVPYVSV